MPPNNSENTANQAFDLEASESLRMSLSVAEREMLDPNERVVTIVRRTFAGIVLIYLETLAAILALAALVILAFPGLFSSLSANSAAWLFAAGVFALALIFFMLFLATYIYKQSKLIVTNKNLIQVLQRGLFSRKVSRLSMSNVEDVSAESSGFLPTFLGYGTLTVETAGEEENFIFPYCPTPEKYADRILDARQAYANRLQEND